MSRKIDSVLDSLERNSTLSADGRAWLIAACDPFHDSDIQIAGYPDTSTASTVCQLIKKQFTIAVPTAGNGNVTPVGANWDCHINMNGLLRPMTVQSRNAFDTGGLSTTTATATNGVIVGGVSYCAGPAGQPTFPTAAAGNVTMSSATVGIPEYIKGNMRLIAAGFEVVNSTAEIYAQGQVTCYRMPSQYSTFNTYNVPTGVRYVNPTLLSRFPPSTLAQAQLLYGTRSWDANEGAYVVLRQNSTVNPMCQPTTQTHTFTSEDIAYNTNSVLFSENGTEIGSELANINGPFDISGAYFTGLSYQTTLTVTVRWLVERMPGPQETDLVVMASPSSPYDPLALELYSRCMGQMPPGVMLKENPLGEWFRSALGAVAKFAPKVGTLVGNFVPGANAVGEVVGNAAKSIRKAIPMSQRELDNKQRKQKSKKATVVLLDPPPPTLQDSKSNLAPARHGVAAR